MTEQNQLMQFLAEIATRSQAGGIDWTQPNPSTFNWNDTQFLVTVQRASIPRRNLLVPEPEESSYLFQVLDKTTKQTVVSLSSKDRPEFARVLAAIYKGAERGMDIRASNVLRNLLHK
jgi:hypothetical protein